MADQEASLSSSTTTQPAPRRPLMLRMEAPTRAEKSQLNSQATRSKVKAAQLPPPTTLKATAFSAETSASTPQKTQSETSSRRLVTSQVSELLWVRTAEPEVSVTSSLLPTLWLRRPSNSTDKTLTAELLDLTYLVQESPASAVAEAAAASAADVDVVASVIVTVVVAVDSVADVASEIEVAEVDSVAVEAAAATAEIVIAEVALATEAAPEAVVEIVVASENHTEPAMPN